jgi:serine/threonine protein kinase
MTPDRWQKIEELYQSARDREERERMAFLKQACEGDEGLREEIVSLLAKEEGAKSFLESPALEVVAKKMAQEQTRSLVGQPLGSYQVLSWLGSGGMGEVYRARDSKLRREVAIKVLPKPFVTDPDRLSRFRREAQLLASLNHPNIATVHGLEQSGSVHYLVMELVEGETLAERIERAGPLPISESLALCRQIAEGLEAAHEKGVIHRDLKPANVKVTPEGRAKVLDFGLAKAFGGNGSPPDATSGAARTELDTETGMILGTPSYMSPEQARGKAVDKRTDIWAFGCVVYELLTGRQAFQGESSADCIVAVVEREPDWKALPTATSPGIRRLLQRCLQKDVNRRLRDIGDARIEIEEALAAPNLPLPVRRRRLATVIAMTLVLLVLTAAGVIWWLTRLSITPPPLNLALTRLTWDSGLTTDPALSPDGKLLAYASDRSGEGHLDIYVRQVGGGEPLRLTRGPGDKRQPSFSPDGTTIAFRSEQEGPGIYVVSALGGAARRIAPGGHQPRFSPDGNWIAYMVQDAGCSVTRNTCRIYVVSSLGGEPRQVRPDFAAAFYAVWSPDGTPAVPRQP